MQYKLYRILRHWLEPGLGNNKPEKKIVTRCEILGIKDSKIPINIFMLYCNPNISCFEIKIMLFLVLCALTTQTIYA